MNVLCREMCVCVCDLKSFKRSYFGPKRSEILNSLCYCSRAVQIQMVHAQFNGSVFRGSEWFGCLDLETDQWDPSPAGEGSTHSVLDGLSIRNFIIDDRWNR